MTATMLRQRKSQRGSIIVYILIAIFLTGLLVSAMSQGAKKSASSEQISEMMLYLQADIQSIQSNITECVVSYQNNNFCPPNANNTALNCVSQFASQDSGNPNVPFPMPGSSAGGAGVALTSMTCPRAPSAQQIIFPANTSVIQSLKLLQDTTNYTTTYFNNTTDGVYFRITRNITDPLWTEAIARLPQKYTSCSSVAETSNPDPTGFNCSNGCFYYFILHPGPGGSPVFGACP